jgi:hypothetical protein
MTGGRSGMRRLKIITGTTRSGYPNNQKQQDTSDFEKQLKAAGLDQVRVKSDPGGKAVTVLYPDDFRMQSLAEDGMHEAAQDGVVEIGPFFGEEGFDPNSTTFKTPYGEVVANYSSNSRAYDDFDADDNQLGDVLNNMDQHPEFDMSDGINHDNVEDYITMCVKKMSSMNENVDEENLGEKDNKMFKAEAKKAPLTTELLQKGYDQVYNFVGEYGDAALEYLDDNAPTFNNLFIKYDGDLDVIASKVDMTTFNQIMDELNDVAYDLEGGVLESKQSSGTISESSAGDAVKQAYDAVYRYVDKYDDAALEYLDDNAPMFTQMFQKYEDLDVLVSKLDDATLMQLKDELDSVADDLSDGVLESKVQENDIEMEEDCGCEDDAMVSVYVQELADILQLAGYENYADKIEEYANEPEEEYSDTEDQLIGLSGGLNRPKKQYPASAPGDNPMDQEPREIEESVADKLYKSYKDFLESEEITKKD